MTADRCNKPLPGGRFLCSREAGHEGRCGRSVFHLDSLCDDREENVVIMPKESEEL